MTTCEHLWERVKTLGLRVATGELAPEEADIILLRAIRASCERVPAEAVSYYRRQIREIAGTVRVFELV
jgi:hypothetical protein